MLCDFRGEAAGEHDATTRLVNRLCVDARNANDWVIPFQQITPHMAETEGEWKQSRCVARATPGTGARE